MPAHPLGLLLDMWVCSLVIGCDPYSYTTSDSAPSAAVCPLLARNSNSNLHFILPVLCCVGVPIGYTVDPRYGWHSDRRSSPGDGLQFTWRDFHHHSVDPRDRSHH